MTHRTRAHAPFCTDSTRHPGACQGESIALSLGALPVELTPVAYSDGTTELAVAGLPGVERLTVGEFGATIEALMGLSLDLEAAPSAETTPWDRLIAATRGRRRKTTVKYRDERVTILHQPWCDVADHVDSVSVFGPEAGCSTPVEGVTLSSGRRATAYLTLSQDGPDVVTDIPSGVMTAADVATVTALLTFLTSLGQSSEWTPDAVKASA